MKKNGLFFKLFGQAVKDKSPEEIEQLAMDAADAFEEEDSSGGGDGTEPGKKEKEGTAQKMCIRDRPSTQPLSGRLWREM